MARRALRGGASGARVRVLVTITPLMYREAIASSLQRGRPDYEVRIAAPQDAEEELRAFLPHLLVRNDTDGLEEAGVLAGIPCRVEVLYSDGMDAKVIVDGRVEEVRDMSTQELVRIADRAASMAR
jgi:hypothetical protein